MVTETTPQRLAQMANDFIERNPEAWEAMNDEAAFWASQGRRFSISKLAEEVRYGMRLNGHDDGFKINNSIRAELARKIRAAHPETMDYLEIRTSKNDRWKEDAR